MPDHSSRRRVSRRFRSIWIIALLSFALELQAAPGKQAVSAASLPPLRVATLNAAHGRSEALNQLFLSGERIRSNLRSMGSLLESMAVDVVALQEADGPSRWSGRFDHVQALAATASFPWHFRGDHARGWLANYGTALLSRQPLDGPRSVRFAPTPPSPRKGYVRADLPWPGSQGGRTVRVVSVHLDFLSRSARERQVQRLVDALVQHSMPTIVLGDFNSAWSDKGSVVRALAERAGLRAFQPDREDLPTYGDKRLDWILISEELRFSDYQVLPQNVSDHLAVVADIEWDAPDEGRPAP